MDQSKKIQIKRPQPLYCLVTAFPLFILAFTILSISLFFPAFTLFILIPFGMVLIYSIYKYLFLRSFRYEISKEKVKWSRGIFGRNVDFLELYRVRDMSVNQPFSLRLINAMHFTLTTSDKSHPLFLFKGIEYSEQWADDFRNLVEHVRKIRVHEVD